MSFMWRSLYDNFDHLLADSTSEKSHIKGSARKAMQISFMKKVKSIFMKYLTRLLVRHSSEYKLNLETGHLFCLKQEQKFTCKCGLFSTKINQQLSVDSFVELSFDDFNPVLDNFDKVLSYEKNEVIEIVRNEESNVKLIDCYESKVNALKIASDILSTVLHIGVFVYN
jgi:hypothetical protein